MLHTLLLCPCSHAEAKQGGVRHCLLLLQVSEPAPAAATTTAPAPVSSAEALPLRLPPLPHLALPHLALQPLPFPAGLPGAEQSRSGAPQAGLLVELNAALPSLVERGLSGITSTEQALLPQQALGSLQADDTVQEGTLELPEVAQGMPGATTFGQLDAAQAPAETAPAPRPEQAQAPDIFPLPRPELSFHLPNLTVPDLPLLSLPSLQLPSQAGNLGLTLAPGAGQAPTPSAHQEADFQVPRLALPDEVLPSLPPLGARGSDPAVRQAASQAAQSPSDDLGPAIFPLPDIALSQLSLPLLAQPELLGLPFGQAPAKSPAASAFSALAQLPTPDAENHSVQANASAEASAQPASEVPSNAALSVIEGAFAPAASALQAGADSALLQLEHPVRLPQLSLPLLAWPEQPRLPYGQAPAESSVLPSVSLTDFASADPVDQPEQAGPTGSGDISAAFPSLEGALAPAMSAQSLLAGMTADLPRLTSGAWSLPQLGVPLLAVPGDQPSASAPAPGLAAAMSLVTHLSPLSSRGPLAPYQAPERLAMDQQYYTSAPSQQPLPVLAPAPAQEGFDLLAGLPRLALPQLPVLSGLAQAPASLPGNQSPDLALSPPPSLATPSSPPQPGLSF